MEELISKLCLLIQLNQDACNSALKASYTNSDVQKEYNTIYGLENKNVKEFINSINKPLLYSGVLIGGGFNTYKTQELKIQAPLKPFADNISMDLVPNSQNIMLNWKWNL